MYAQALHWFTIIGLSVFLGASVFIDIVKYFIDVQYHEGLFIVPIVLLANLFLGMFFSLSVWYKLTDKTIYGAILAIIGSIITATINVIFVPKYGYEACAWANLACYFTILVISYLWGHRYYRVPYNISKLGFYFLMAAILFGTNYILPTGSMVITYALKTILVGLFFVVVMFKEPALRNYMFRFLPLK